MSSSPNLQLLTLWTLNCTDGTHSLHSRTDCLHYDYTLITISITHWLLWPTLTHQSLYYYADPLHTHYDNTDFDYSVLLYIDWIQLGRSTDIASEQTRWKHRLWRLLYCCVLYHITIQAAHWSAGRCPAENGLLLLSDVTCACAV
jgi:hypothetical protein